MSSNRRPWVPNLQLPLLRSFILQRPLPFASPLWILLWLIFCRYHLDRLAPIYRLMEALKSSETAHAPKCRSKVLSCSPCASTCHCTFGLYLHALPCVASSGHAPSCASTAPQYSYWHHSAMSALVVSSLTSLACVNCRCHRLTFGELTFCNPGAPYPVFRVDFNFAVHFHIFCF